MNYNIGNLNSPLSDKLIMWKFFTKEIFWSYGFTGELYQACNEKLTLALHINFRWQISNNFQNTWLIFYKPGIKGKDKHHKNTNTSSENWPHVLNVIQEW